jgi:hypothetical protein
MVAPGYPPAPYAHGSLVSGATPLELVTTPRCNRFRKGAYLVSCIGSSQMARSSTAPARFSEAAVNVAGPGSEDWASGLIRSLRRNNLRTAGFGG